MNFLSKFKKGLSLALLLAVSTVSVVSAQFTDQAEIPSWANEAISELGAIGVMTGNDDGSFAPNAILNRAEVSKIIVLAADVAIDTTGGAHFPDVAEGAWYYDYVETMYNYGWIGGYPDGDFRPGNTINRAEMAKMVVNAFEIAAVDNGPSFSDVSANDWFYDKVETVKANSIMLGYADGTFDPAGDVTRAEAAKIIYEGLLVATEVTGPAAGTLEVSLSNDTPRGTNIPYNATSVPFTTLELSAADDSDIEVSSITLTRLGLGDNDDFDSVWLEIDGFKVGNDRSVNNDDIVELRFNPPIVVPAGQTLVADVVASTKYTLAADGTCFDTGAEGCNIGHFNRFAVVSADDIVSTAANVVGGFPVEGEEMQVANYQVSQMVMSTLGSATTVNVGDSFVELGKFRMLNASTTNKDIEMRAITFKNQGTAELANVLENFALYVSGEQVSAETIIDGDYVTFRLDNGVTGGYVIEDGDSRIFSMRADVVSAEANDNIKFKVDNFEDIVGIEIGTAFGVKTVDTAGNNAEDANATLQTYTIDSGDINVSRDPNSLGNQEYAPGSNDVVAMTARIVVSQPILVDGVTLKVDSYATANNTLAELNEYFDNFRLYLNDNLIDSENSISGTTAAPVLNYASQFEITGASVMKLVLNVQDAATTGSFIKFSLFATDFDSPEYISSGDTVVTADLLGSALASKVEVQQSILTITRTDGYTTETIVAGVQDATFMKFVMDNNDSGDVNVTSITIQGLGTGVAATNYSNFTASLFVDGQQIGSSKTLNTTTGTASFNDIAVVIPSAGQEEFTVVMDTIEAVATEALANTTVADDGLNTANVIGGALCAAAVTTDSSSPITCAAGILAPGVKAGDTVAIATGNPAPNDFDYIIVTADASAGATAIAVNLNTVDGSHAGALSAVAREYPIGTTTFAVANTANISVGDTLAGTTPACVVAAVTATSVTCTAATATTAVLPVGTPLTEAAGGSTIRMAVIATDVDNAENGSPVDVYEANELLVAASTTDNLSAIGALTGVGADCGVLPVATPANTVSGSNYLCGGLFSFTTSGTLTINNTTLNSDKILIAGATDVEVYKVEFNAADDEVQIKDLFLTNIAASPTDFDSRATFKLYNEAGQLLATEQMIGGELHFELNSNKIMVPMDGNTVVTVKVDVNGITSGSDTGKLLELDIDAAKGTNGILAVTGATGSDLELAAVTDNTTAPAGSNLYVAYRTALTFANAATQPSWNGAPVANEPIFNFTVTNDTAHSALLNELTVLVSVVDATVAGAAGDLQLVRHSSASFNDSNPFVVGTDATTASTIDFTSPETIDGTMYYQLRIIPGYTDAGGSDFSEIKVSFLADAAPAVNAAAAPLLGAHNVVWSDRSNNGGAGFYMNGYELDMPIGNAEGVTQQ